MAKAPGKTPGGGRRGEKQADTSGETGRGRDAERPGRIPLSGWRDIALRVWTATGDDNISLLAAGVAFYSLLALFPSIAALVSLYGLLADPAAVQEFFVAARPLLPEAAWSILNGQLTAVASQPRDGLTLAAVFGTAFALFSGRLGALAMIGALNVVYNERERRGVIMLNLLALAFTLGAIALVIAALLAIIAVPVALAFVGLDSVSGRLVAWLRWPFLAVVIVLALSFFYRYAPDRRQARWRWVSWGSVLATALWLASSVLFSWYISVFGAFNEIYGSLGAVIILILWLWLSAYVVLFGAELDMQMEHQTGKDTTVGPEKPRGERGAYVADTIGRKP